MHRIAGEIGDNSNLLTNYFERNGATPCPSGANAAEWMLEAIGAAPGSSSEVDWYQTWRSSPEYQAVQNKLTRLESLKEKQSSMEERNRSTEYQEFAAPLWQQFVDCYAACMPNNCIGHLIHLL